MRQNALAGRHVASRKRIGHNRWGFVVFPVVFVLLAAGLVFFALRPVLSPALAVTQLFMAPNAPTVTAPKNLLPETVLLPPVSSQGETSPPPPTIPLSGIAMPALGDQYAQLTVSGTAIDAPVFWGDDVPQLNAGIGTYSGGSMPGFGGTIMLAGHTGSWLIDMESVELGAVITLQTHYGLYTYEVIEMTVKDHEDSSAYDFSRQDENIILYTCYPFRTLGLTQDRYFVYGKPLCGPVVDKAA